MPAIIRGRFGIGYRQSPYLFNLWHITIAEGNTFEGVTVRSNYIKFYEVI